MRDRTDLTRRVAFCSLLSVLLSSGCALSGGDLLFLSGADGDLDIYVSESGSVRRLTDNQHDDLHASWAPDGTRIVYTSIHDGNPDIVVMRADGRDQRRLTTDPGLDAYPAWSPDSREVAFVSTRNRREQIYAIGVDGSGLRALTPDALSANLPVWSPDGNTIAFIEGTDQGSSLATIDRDGGNYRSLVEGDGGAINGIVWSPDGSRILYAARRSKNVDIYVVDVDTGVESRLTTDPWIDAEPAWSPDGSRIAWLSARDDTTRRQVSVMNADGSDQRNVSGSGVEEMQPQWSPDGRLIAFVGHRDRHFVVYVLDPESGQRTLPAGDLSGASQFQPFFNPRYGFVPRDNIGVAHGTAPAYQYSATKTGDADRAHTRGDTYEL